MPEQQPASPPAPYLPFKTFLSSLDVFQHGVPPKIDRTIWRQSGLTQGLIMSAYRFFNLIDENDRPTEILLAIVASKARASDVKLLLNVHYTEIIKHDLTKITPKMLEDLIEQYGVSGSTKKKSITFFLQAAKYAEMPLSAFLQTQIRNTSGARRRRQKSQDNGGDAVLVAAPPTGSSKSVELKSGGRVTVHVSTDFISLSAEDRAFVFELIDRVSVYEKRLPLRAVKASGE